VTQSYVATTQKDIVKILQYVKEGSYNTPANFGVIPTASPAFTAAGRVQEIDTNPDTIYEESLALGNYDIADAIKTQELAAFKFKCQFADSTLAKFGFNVPDGTANTASESLSFLFSKTVDATEKYVIITGCRPQSTMLSLDRGLWTMEMSIVGRDIAAEASSSGLTTPTYASAYGGTMWGHTGLAASGFTWNSVVYDHRKFSITCNHDLALTESNGDPEILFSKVAGRKITASIDVYKKDTVLRADHKAGTLRSASMSVNGYQPSLLSFTNARINKYAQKYVAGSKDVLAEQLQLTIGTVSIS
jgi:hypothetical protein